MQNQIDTLVATIKADYAKWLLRGKSFADAETHVQNMINEFNNRLTVKTGSKYIKIINNGVWGFIVNTDNDKKFKRGDILKAAGFNAPARNAARGNIVDGGYTVQWTGPLYLK